MRRLIVIAKCVGGGLLIAAGIVLIPLPGPGTPLILLGLFILGTEFAWAARLQTQLTSFVRRLWRRTSDDGAVASPAI